MRKTEWDTFKREITQRKAAVMDRTWRENTLRRKAGDGR